MVENSNKEIIEQLERLDFLLEEAIKNNEYVTSGCAREYGEKIKSIIMTVDDLGSVPSVFKNMPVFPIDNSELPALKQEYEKHKKIFTFFLAPTVISILAGFLISSDFINIISTVCVIATVFYSLIFSQSKKPYKEKEKAYNDSVEKSEKSLAEYRKALSVYEEEKAEGISAAQEFAKEYADAYKKHKKLLVEYENSKRSAMEAVVENVEEAKTIDFVPEEYYTLVKPMISMLKSGRADNYKEALNMAIEEDRQKKIEAARRAEEARRTQIMEEQAITERLQAEEMQRHNRQMEAEQQRQNKMMLEEQRKQAEKASREATKQADAAKYVGVSKCTNCMNNTKCPNHIKRSGGGLNCGAYTPYGSR